MNDLDLVLQAIAALHDTCFDDSSWATALALVTRVLRSSTATFGSQTKTQTFSIMRSSGLPPEATEAYATHFHLIDPVIAHVRSAPTGVAYTDWMAVNPERFEKTRFANEYAAPFDMRHCVQAITDQSINFSGFLVAARPDRGGAYTEEDRRLVHSLLPHVRQALQIRRHLQQIEGEKLAALDVLDRLSHAAFLVDADLKVIFANREAENLLDKHRGLLVRNGVLTTGNPADTIDLQRAVRRTIDRELDPAPQPLTVKRPSSPRPLLVRVVPLSARIADGTFEVRASAFVLVADPDRPAESDQLNLGPIFDLTPTETKCAWLLADGLSAATIATEMGVSVATVRTHLAHIFEKTGVRRQAEIVVLLQQFRRF